MQAWLQAVAMQCAVSKCRADAVFGEPATLYAQLVKHCEDGRRDSSVAFQFDDYDVMHRAAVTRGDVVEYQVRVDGETLGHTLVDECDAVEAVLKLFAE